MDLNKKNMKRIALLIAFGLLLYWGLNHPGQAGQMLSTVFSIFLPFLLGGCLAFLLNVILRPVEPGLAARLGKTVRPPAKTGPAAGVPAGEHSAAGGGCLRHLLHCGPCPEGQRGKLCQPAPQPADPSGALVEQPGGFSGGPLHSAAGILAQFRQSCKTTSPPFSPSMERIFSTPPSASPPPSSLWWSTWCLPSPSPSICWPRKRL